NWAPWSIARNTYTGPVETGSVAIIAPTKGPARSAARDAVTTIATATAIFAARNHPARSASEDFEVELGRVAEPGCVRRVVLEVVPGQAVHQDVESSAVLLQ